MAENKETDITSVETNKKEYNPSGRRVKVKDMRPGYMYTFTDMSIEDYHEAEYPGDYERAKNTHKFLDNQGLVLRPLRPYGDGRYWVELCSVRIKDHMRLVPNSPKAKGLYWEKTGSKIWSPYEIYKTGRLMYPEEEVVEVHPFPVGLYKEGYQLELLPDPQYWYEVSKNTSHTKSDDYVQVWDESDKKILIVLGVLSVIILFGGPTAIPSLGAMWLLAAYGFKIKHDRIRERVLEERERLGVRGSGLDDLFWWRK